MKLSSITSDDRLRLADRIRAARRSGKLTQSALADRVGVTASAAAQWEHPHGTRPELSHLQSIAAATGVTFEWLAIGFGDKRRRGMSDEDSTPALKLDVFAQDRAEEILLERFRALSPRGKQMLAGFLEEFRSGRR